MQCKKPGIAAPHHDGHHLVGIAESHITGDTTSGFACRYLKSYLGARCTIVHVDDRSKAPLYPRDISSASYHARLCTKFDGPLHESRWILSSSFDSANSLDNFSSRSTCTRVNCSKSCLSTFLAYSVQNFDLIAVKAPDGVRIFGARICGWELLLAASTIVEVVLHRPATPCHVMVPTGSIRSGC